MVFIGIGTAACCAPHSKLPIECFGRYADFCGDLSPWQLLSLGAKGGPEIESVRHPTMRKYLSPRPRSDKLTGQIVRPFLAEARHPVKQCPEAERRENQQARVCRRFGVAMIALGEHRRFGDHFALHGTLKNDRIAVFAPTQQVDAPAGQQMHRDDFICTGEELLAGAQFAPGRS